MKTRKMIGIMMAISLTVGALGYLSAGIAAEGKSVEQMITEAKTPADHEAIAAYYETEAQEAHKKHAQHQKMSDSYATIPVLKTKTGAVTHCNTIAKKYEQIAKEYETLAKLHKDMVKPAK
ncbi:MAG: hypothetical protein HYZ50_03075 [Deltaproteobacteria bacterium]|nr:hypothetical protein [Deltaproteobacteria bacterium]